MNILEYSFNTIQDKLYPLYMQYIAYANTVASIVILSEVIYICGVISYVLTIHRSSIFIEIGIFMFNILLIIVGCIAYDCLIWLLNMHIFTDNNMSYISEAIIACFIAFICIITSISIKSTMRHYCFLSSSKHNIMSNVLLIMIAIAKATIFYMIFTNILYYAAYSYHEYFVQYSFMSKSLYYVWNHLLY